MKKWAATDFFQMSCVDAQFLSEFYVDAKENWFAHGPNVSVVIGMKFPANGHVLSVVSSKGDVMLPISLKMEKPS